MTKDNTNNFADPGYFYAPYVPVCRPDTSALPATPCTTAVPATPSHWARGADIWRQHGQPDGCFDMYAILAEWESRGEIEFDTAESEVTLDHSDEIPLQIESEFIPRRGILTRYGKKILADGANHYKNMTIKDFKV